MKTWPLLLILPLYAYINQNNDVQIWVEEYMDAKITSDLSIDIKNQWRFGNNASELYHIYLQGLLGYGLTDEAFIASGYRQTWRRSSTAPWSLEYEPIAECIFRRIHGWAGLDVRNRISYIIREVGENSWHWRGRVRWMMREGPCRPYLSNELFMNLQTGFDQDRIMFGVLIPFIEHVRGDLYYMLRFLNGAEYVTHQHIFGLGLDLQF